MKFTKAQSAILDEIGNTNDVPNYSQRMRAIQPLLDANIIKRTNILGSDGFLLRVHWELV